MDQNELHAILAGLGLSQVGAAPEVQHLKAKTGGFSLFWGVGAKQNQGSRKAARKSVVVARWRIKSVGIITNMC